MKPVAIAGAIAAAAGLVLLGRCSAPDPAPLPPKVAAAVERHAIASGIDSTEIRRLETARDVAKRRETTARAAQLQAEERIRAYKLSADSLAAAADRAQTSADSAAAWHQAYDARTAERDFLVQRNTATDSVLGAVRLQLAGADSVADRWKAHALRADSLVAQLIPLAEHRDLCKIAWLIPCPTRKEAAIVGAIAGAATVGVLTGKIRIPLLSLARAQPHGR